MNVLYGACYRTSLVTIAKNTIYFTSAFDVRYVSCQMFGINSALKKLYSCSFFQGSFLVASALYCTLIS